MPLFGAAYTAPNKGTTILYGFRSPKTVLNLPVNGRFQGLIKAFECFSSSFHGRFIFSRTFQDSHVNSSTFQACANPGTVTTVSLLTYGPLLHRMREVHILALKGR